MKQQPLLTHDQLVDWLIYHRPLEELKFAQAPFMAVYVTSDTFPLTAYTQEMTPWKAYDQLAKLIMIRPAMHREITDLYWYWTIES